MIDGLTANSIEYIAGLKEPNQRPDLLLVNSPINDYNRIPKPDTEELPSFGLAYIATEAEKAGFNVGVIDAEMQAMRPELVSEVINRVRPKWVGINLLTPTYSLARNILAGVNSDIMVVAGAAHAKAMPEEVLRDPIIGQRIKVLALEDGEYIMRGLLQGIYPEEMSGVAYLDKHGDFQTKPHDLEKKWIPWQLDNLHYPDRKFLVGDPFSSQGRIESNLVGSRGCAFHCKFCAGAREMLLAGVRSRSITNIVGEMGMLREEGINSVRFIDDLFLANRKRINEFFVAMIETGLNKDFVWDATARVNILSRLDDKTLEMMALSGCREVSVGAESASPRVLQVMDKDITPDMVTETVKRLAKVGIRTKGYFILGTPSETQIEMEQTVEFMHYLRNVARAMTIEHPITPIGMGNNAQFRGSMFEFRPYPGTPFYNWITGRQVWPEGIWQGKHPPYLYTDSQILEGFQPVFMEGLEERQKHNYTTNLQFAEVPPKQIQEMIAEAMKEQRDDMHRHGEYLPGVKTVRSREVESR